MGGKYSSGYVEKITVCPVCYCARVQTDVSSGTLCKVLVGLSFIVISILSIGKISIWFIPLIFGGAIFWSGLHDIVGETDNKKQAQIDCDAFMISIARKKAAGYFTCHQCGTKMDIRAKSCPVCGDPTTDEWRLPK